MKDREFTWKISAFTAETIPLSRLTDYLSELATMLGDPKGLHLLRVETGSTVPVLKADSESYEAIVARAREVRSNSAPAVALKSYRRINEMLRRDQATAALSESGAEIIAFPGIAEPESLITGVTQRGSIDGELQQVGGAKLWVPVHLKSLDGDRITGCFANRRLAKQLGNHLFEPIRLHGKGRWARTTDGRWVLDKFWIETFDRLRDDSFTALVRRLRAVETNWIDEPIADILKDERCSGAERPSRTEAAHRARKGSVGVYDAR